MTGTVNKRWTTHNPYYLRRKNEVKKKKDTEHLIIYTIIHYHTIFMYVVPADAKKDRKKIPDIGRMHGKF